MNCTLLQKYKCITFTLTTLLFYSLFIYYFFLYTICLYFIDIPIFVVWYFSNCIQRLGIVCHFGICFGSFFSIRMGRFGAVTAVQMPFTLQWHFWGVCHKTCPSSFLFLVALPGIYCAPLSISLLYILNTSVLYYFSLSCLSLYWGCVREESTAIFLRKCVYLRIVFRCCSGFPFSLFTASPLVFYLQS